MIEISDGLFVAARHVAVVKKLSNNSCAVFTVGQSAVDGGFHVERPALEVATDVMQEVEEDREREAAIFAGDETEEEEPEDGEED